MIAKRVIEEVEAAGIQALRSFDLDVVRSSNKGYCCPIHKNVVCTCQLVILLIMQKERGFLAMTMEGSDQQTWIYIDSNQGGTEEQVDPSLTIALTHAFFSKEIH